MHGAGDVLSALIADGPLAWRPWQAATLDEAVERDLPILLLMGESCDHWTAQQFRQIHEDAELADLIDTAFVPAFAAQHLEPMLARRVQECLAVTSDTGGLPAICFCTPAGAPIAALPYRPARDADGQVGLARFCLQVAQAWSAEADALRAQAAALAGAWRAGLGQARSDLRSGLLLDAIDAQLMAQADTIAGGFGGAPKRPQPALLAYLVERATAAEAAPSLREQAMRSCQALVAGAIHDQLGGAWHRGCIDALWVEPLFEKRLRDQALLAPILHQAASAFDQPLLGELAAQALDWAVEHLRHADGSFAHGMHAVSRDAQGRVDNGAHYRWTVPGIANVVGKDGAELVVRRFCDAAAPVTAFQTFSVRQELDAAAMARLPSLCARLFAARSERPLPPLEPWTTIAEQGMMLHACASLAGRFQRFAKIAGQLFEQLAGPMDAGGLAHSWHPLHEAHGAADSADLAWAARGALSWYRVSEDDEALRLGRHWLERLLGPWHRELAATDGTNLQPEPVACVADDDEGPSPLAVALQACLDLQALEPADGAAWIRQARDLLIAHAAVFRDAPLAVAGLAAAVHRCPAILDG